MTVTHNDLQLCNPSMLASAHLCIVEHSVHTLLSATRVSWLLVRQQWTRQMQFAYQYVLCNKRVLKLKQLKNMLPFFRASQEHINTTDQLIWSTQHVVYVRFNFVNNDFYIGRTNAIYRRYKEHTIATKKHANGACKTKQCNACRSYTKQARIPIQKWCMIPILFCTTEQETITMEKRLIKRFKPNLNWEYTWTRQLQQTNLHIINNLAPKSASNNNKNRLPPRLREKTTHPDCKGPSEHYFATSTTYQILDFIGPTLNTMVGYVRANEIPNAKIEFQKCNTTDTTNWKQLSRTSGAWDTWFMGKVAPLKTHLKEIKKCRKGTIIFLEYTKGITKTNAKKLLASRKLPHTLEECEETLLPRLWRALDLFPIEKRKI